MKERLTEKDNKGRWCVKQTRKVDYATVYNCEGSYIIGTPIDRLAQLEDKIENGTLIELPCKVGEWVYGCTKQISRVIHGVVYKITVDKKGVYYTTYENDGLQEYWLDDVYKTQEEAEAKLKELRGGV